MINTLIFDIGGVLITPSEKITPYILSSIFSVTLETALKAYNDSLHELRTGTKKIIQMTEEISSSNPGGQNGTDDIESLYMQYYNKQAVVDRKMIEFVAGLKEKYHTVALSNMLDLHVKCNSERGLFDVFHKLYLSSKTGLVKPDPDAFKQVFDDLKIGFSQALFIEDSEKNVNAARSMGITSYKFDTLINLRGFLEKHGVV